MMTIFTQAKRLVYLIHRWTGVAACVLIALWFVSGMVMLYVGYPKLTPWERLRALPALSTENCCISPERALAYSRSPKDIREIVLTSIRQHPYYRLRERSDDGQDAYVVVDAVSGERAASVNPDAALESARAFLPGYDAHYLGRIHEDRWTHAGSLDGHRPLYQIQMDDPAHTLLYVSGVTGEVVLDAPRAQRLWNYIGAWLHWLYLFRDQSHDPGWSWIVIVLSGIGVITSLSGTLVGIWRWRFTHRYKSGSRSPYRAPYLYWHHIIGLMFATIACTWIFSGLMSMRPFGLLDAKGERPNISTYQAGTPGRERLALPVTQALTLLHRAHFTPSEIEWRVINGQPYLLARNAAAATRLIVRSAQEKGKMPQFDMLLQWPEPALQRAGARLLTSPIRACQWITDYDHYYYARQPEAMMGASERRLPSLRLYFADASDTMVQLDPYTGDVQLSMDRSQRLGRWLFNFLHSWDLPWMLRMSVMREIVLILLSLGGLSLSVTGIVIGVSRVRLWISKLKKHSW